jgi:hypothetical protein
LPSAKDIAWEDLHIGATENFFMPMQPPKDGEWFQYLRPVNALLVFPGGTVLLLSDMETEMVLASYNSSGFTSSTATMYHLSSFRNGGVGTALACGNPSRPLNRLSDDQITALLLFAGDTSFGTPARLECLRKLLPTGKSGDAADQLLAARSTSHLYDQSDLFTMREKLANETKVKELVDMGAISALE